MSAIPITTETQPSRFSTGLTGLFFFLLSETFFFGSLFFSYFYFAFFSRPWNPPAPVQEIDVTLATINTVVLLSSGVTMHIGHLAIQKGNRQRMKLMLLITIILGVAFLSGQAWEYIHLRVLVDGMSQQALLSSGVFPQFFFTMTGFHGLHVTGGVLFLIYVYWRALKGQFSQQRHLGVETCAYYWHFVDVVWVFLYAVLYLPFNHWF